jgi:alkylated DNA repair dioxygenase AlkB
MNNTIFKTIKLDDECNIYISKKSVFNLNQSKFINIWNIHPKEFHKVIVYGNEFKTPRWTQTYGKNYFYAGTQSKAIATPKELEVFLNWAKNNIDTNLNGVLVNWYDGNKKHCIGAHRDDIRDLCNNSSIVTISIGEERIFRMRPYKQKGFKDFTLQNGDIIIIPWITNLHWTHEIPSFAKYNGKRISITLRTFL